MAELYGTLADVKIALSDARETLHEKDLSIQKLRAEIEALKSGEVCPICQTGKMKTTASVEDPIFGVFGHQQRTVTCQNPGCGHTEKRKIAPDGGR